LGKIGHYHLGITHLPHFRRCQVKLMFDLQFVFDIIEIRSMGKAEYEQNGIIGRKERIP
jgi:hypothetical protein